MNLGWNTVIHVIVFQAAIAFYYLIWPVLSKGSVWLLGRLANYLPSPEPPEIEKPRAYRGNWRDAHYQRTRASDGPERQERRKQKMGKARANDVLKAKHLHLLGLREPAHLMDIKAAYRSMARTYHPDRYAAGDYSDAKRTAAAKKMRQINEAYDWLCANA